MILYYASHIGLAPSKRALKRSKPKAASALLTRSHNGAKLAATKALDFTSSHPLCCRQPIASRRAIAHHVYVLFPLWSLSGFERKENNEKWRNLWING